MVNQEDILAQLDQLKKKDRPWLTPQGYREFLPAVVPNVRTNTAHRDFAEPRRAAAMDLVQSMYNVQDVKQRNTIDYETLQKSQKEMVRAQKQVKKAKKMDRPVIQQPDKYINIPNNKGGGSNGASPQSGPSVGPINTSGPGWKDPTPGIGRPTTSNVVTRMWHGRPLTLNPQAMDNFIGFLNALTKTGYKVTSLGGHVVRNIAGTSTPSLHSYGLAIDINPSSNPVTYGAPVTNLPKGVGALAAKYGLAWGGAWNGSKKDTMHFSIPYAGTK